ncbi:hypothetical protein Ciccas_008809, partial [Cichlidogyrus casuarinus]
MDHGFDVLELESREENKKSAENYRSKLDCETKCKTVIELLFSSTKCDQILNENVDKLSQYESILICGLHACGNLSNTVLRNFVNSNYLTHLIVVPCCYHLLREDPNLDPTSRDRMPDWATFTDSEFDFPMSKIIRENFPDFYLGQNALSLASYSIERTKTNPEKFILNTRRATYRALLEVLLRQK